MKTDFLTRIFYTAIAENGFPCEEYSLDQLYKRIQQTKDVWNPIENLLKKLHVCNSVVNDFEDAISALADAYEEQGFINGFRLGMMLREELDVSNLDTRKENTMPEKIRVTITREDGSPLFPQHQTAQAEYLTEAAPVLVVLRDGGTVRTHQGDLQSALDFIEGLALPY